MTDTSPPGPSKEAPVFAELETLTGIDFNHLDPQILLAVRDDLLGCPPQLKGTAISLFHGSELAGDGGVDAELWAGIVTAVIPDDGACPDTDSLARLLNAAALCGWTNRFAAKLRS